MCCVEILAQPFYDMTVGNYYIPTMQQPRNYYGGPGAAIPQARPRWSAPVQPRFTVPTAGQQQVRQQQVSSRPITGQQPAATAQQRMSAPAAQQQVRPPPPTGQQTHSRPSYPKYANVVSSRGNAPAAQPAQPVSS